MYKRQTQRDPLHAAAELAMNLVVTEGVAMISMNVAATMEAVHTHAPTQLAHSSAAVELDTHWQGTEGVAVTSMNVQLGLTTVNSCAPIHKAHSHAPVALDSHSTAMDTNAQLVS